MRKRFSISQNCLKIPNGQGIVLSLGGDDNCRDDGIRDRLSVLFEDSDGNDVVPEWLSDVEKECLKDNGEISVWGNPDTFNSLLERHLKAV